MPFSRTVMVITTSRVSWPASCFFWPVSFTSKSTSYSFCGSEGFSSFSLPCSFCASFAARSSASRILRRISSKVVTTYDFFFMSTS